MRPCLPLSSAPAVQISGHTTLPSNKMGSLMNAITYKGPVTVYVAASRWFSYKRGIFDDCNSWILDHAVQLVGYGVDATTGTKFW